MNKVCLSTQFVLTTSPASISSASPSLRSALIHLTNQLWVAVAFVRCVAIRIILHPVSDLLHLILRELLEGERDDAQEDLRVPLL